MFFYELAWNKSNIINIMDITNCNLLKDFDFVDNIEFSENIMPKKEIKEEEEFDQEVWKFSRIF